MGQALWALGLMSGTSLDGVDAALLKTDGESILEFGPSAEMPYHEGAANWAMEVTRNWSLYRQRVRGDDMAVELLNAENEVIRNHAAAVAGVLTRPKYLVQPPLPDVIGFHGQTVAHSPANGWTWQIGDGGALARSLNRTVVWDFRTADVMAGGEGAPLAPFFHFALARHIGATEPVVFLNIGGVANVTWVDPSKSSPEEEGALVAFDTGPGNALLNDWMDRRTGKPLDRDGKAAAAGRVDPARLKLNSASAYLNWKPPKSLDRNEFEAMLKVVDGLSAEDGAATLTALTVECIADSLRHMPSRPSRWLVCGGGRKNRTMMRMLSERLEGKVETVEAAGLDGDMIEAQAFAFLAVRVLYGLPTSAPGTTGCREPVVGGQIARP